MKLETRRKLINLISNDINHLIKNERCDEWHFAAGRSINKQILGNLDPVVKKRLKKNIFSDLTKKHKTDLLGLFEIT